MNCRQRIMAAFAPDGTTHTPVVASYETLFLRDHYHNITTIPWWERQFQPGVAADLHRASGLEWTQVGACAPRDVRQRQKFEQTPDGVWLVDPLTGDRRILLEPLPGGTNTSSAAPNHGDAEALPDSPAAIDSLIPLAPSFDKTAFQANGRHDIATDIRSATGLFTYGHISSPFWSLYNVLGYEAMMIMLAQNPGLIAYATERILHNVLQQIRLIGALNADAVWIEECLTDQISPELFASLNLPLVQRCCAEIGAQGMKSIYYYCGNPWTRFDSILASNADALHFEEGKKGFEIDIEHVVERTKGHCVVFGNLDAVSILQNGSPELLRREIGRQMAAGRRNRNRFVMSIGSPITPDTPVERVRMYSNMVRELSQTL